MVSLQTPLCDFGWKAPDFDLPGVDGKRYRLSDLVGPRGLLLMFICNHCPYVKAVRSRIVRDAQELRAQGIHSVAINANDATQYAEDNFEHMKIIIVSGVVNQEEINDLLQAGADDFVKKPFNIEKLIERMTELLQLA